MSDFTHLRNYLSEENEALNEGGAFLDAVTREVNNLDKVGILMPGEIDDDYRYILWDLIVDKDKLKGEVDTDQSDTIDGLAEFDNAKHGADEFKDLNSADVTDDELEKCTNCPDLFDYIVGLWIWIPEGQNEPFVSLYAEVQYGAVRRHSTSALQKQWIESKRLAGRIGGKVNLGVRGWKENEIEWQRMLLNLECSPSRVAEAIVSLAHKVRKAVIS